MSAARQPVYRLAGKRVFVAGHRGMVGGALMRRLQSEQCEILAAGRGEIDLRRQADVEAWMMRTRPQAIFVAAAKVGGILANDSYPADFLYDNLAIEINLIEAARRAGVEKLLFLGSSCIYPRLAPQPIAEDALLSGPLEPTNQWYAVAKIAGLMLCRAYRRQYSCDYISAMPTNVYGPGDNFDLRTSHVVPALMVKAHAAKRAGKNELEIWGSGAPRREFIFVDDLADALVFLMTRYSDEEHVNIGFGSDVTIKELAEQVAAAVGFAPSLRFDASKPDGTPQKLLDSTKLLSMGWKPRMGLPEGLRATYAWYLAHAASGAKPNPVP